MTISPIHEFEIDLPGSPAAGLIAPHGGRLVNLLLDGPRWERAREEARSLPSVQLDPRQLNDLEMLVTGALSPLEGFMGQADYRSVIERVRLAGGQVWPIPVVLGLTDEQRAGLGRTGSIALADQNGPLAILRVSEIFEPDLEAEAAAVYGTTDPAHPGVAAIQARGRWLAAGRVEALGRPYFDDFSEARLTPAQTRAIFAERGWRRVAAFQTRNPIHRAHEYLLRVALELTDGLLVHPLMGATKAGDIPGDVRWRCYETLLEKYFPPDRVLLSIFPANMHYAGPREAIYHALARKNYGVTHFIVGRDHAGVGNYYGSYDAQQIFDRFDPAEIGIEPLRFEHSFWSHRLEGMASFKTCAQTEQKDIVVLSGTKVRQMFEAGIVPPEQFTRREVAEVLIGHYRDQAHEGNGKAPAAHGAAQDDAADWKPRYQQGLTLWFTGLSGAGKSTLSQALAPLLKARGRSVEILDGDEVRENLSKGLGFSKEDRDTNIKRIGYVCRLLTRHGAVAISAAISPYREVRDFNRALVGNFIEIYCEADLDSLVERDVKGLYKKALAGEIKNFTGVSDPYEPPVNPEIVVRTDRESIEQSVARIIEYLEREEWIR